MIEGKHAVLGYATRDGDGAVLSVWNKKYKVWGLAGGKVEEGETLLAALYRELEEEVGLRWGSGRVPTEIYTMPTYSGSGRMCHVYALGELDVFDVTTTELDAGVGWMSREFLCSQTAYDLGAWFKKFFTHVDDLEAAR